MDLIQLQQEMENDCLAEGAKRFRKRLEAATKQEALASVGAARTLLKLGLERIELAIEDMCEHPPEGPRHCAIRVCKAVGYDTAAYMTLKSVLDVVGQRKPLRKVATGLAGLIMDELRWRKFREQAPGLLEYKLKKFNTSNYTHMKHSLDHAMAYAKVDTSEVDALMTSQQRMRVGVKLIDLLIEHTGLVTYEHYTAKAGRGFKGHSYLQETESTAEWMNDRNALLELRTPVNLPMVVPPRDWEPGVRGGYRFAMQQKYGMVRTYTEGGAGRDLDVEMPEVYESLNTVQAVPYRLNQKVWQVVEEIYTRGLAIAGVPSFVPAPEPPRPADIDFNEKARLQYRKDKSQWHEREHMRKVKATEFVKTLSIVERVKGLDAFWYPWNLDFRGREYPIPNYLTPQGDDIAKGLLEFASAEPVGDGGVGLALHGVNVMDECPWTKTKLTKLPLQERVNWIASHTDDIVAAATSPLTHKWWSQAEKPLQFLAFCFAWKSYTETGSSTMCSLPIAQDGSCNGIQHFSALLRDPIGAQAVNMGTSLDATEEPNDLYDLIATDVHSMLTSMLKVQQQTSLSGTITAVVASKRTTRTKSERSAASATDSHRGDTSKSRGTSGNESTSPSITEQDLAQLWISSGLVNRKLTKRPTMTFGYGSKQFGFKEQLIEFLKDKVRNEEEVRLPEDHWDAGCTLMAKCIWTALGTRVVAAYHAMAWMQKVTRMVVNSSLRPVEWTAPTGFPVKQEYYQVERERVKTVLAGQVIKPSVYRQTDEINTLKQANAVAPNFVHSLDASALMKTVLIAKDMGVSNFAMVHDSYATTAGSYTKLATATRQAFVEMYTEHDVINDFYAELLAQYDGEEELPEPPEMGDFDINEVLDAQYFFA